MCRIKSCSGRDVIGRLRCDVTSVLRSSLIIACHVCGLDFQRGRMGEEDLRVRCVFAFECANVCMHARECGSLVSHVSLHVEM